MEYEEIGLRIGLEVHNRLATGRKLFCACLPRFSREEPFYVIRRRQRAVAGESGHIDKAAEFEQSRARTFHYLCFEKETCLVETDSEPPHAVDKEALFLAFQIAKIFRAEIPDEIHTMRKIVVDGSNTSGFQRTMLIGMNGVLDTSMGPVRISNICLEEESAGIVEKRGRDVVYRLDRLGIPLIEVGTETDIKTPEHAKEVAEKIGMIIRSTGKSQRGIGVTRQDINVSIKGGARVEIKGVQELDMIPAVIRDEIERQKKLVLAGESKEETRMLRKDGTTVYTRPLPGRSRMYPETDLPVMVVDRKVLEKIKLPETWEEKKKRISKILPKEMVSQLLKSEELERWERLSKNFDPKLVASTLLFTLKDIKRKGVDVSQLKDKHLQDVFLVVQKNIISKDVISDVLEAYSRNPGKTVGEIIAFLGLERMSEQEVRKIVRKVIRKNPKLVKQKSIGALMGDIMKEVRGKADGRVVSKILREELGE